MAILEQDPSFDADMAHAIAEAYHQVCKHLQDAGQPLIVQEVISKRIINAAKDGERDPSRLRDLVLESFGLKRDAP
jgi:methionine synthase II (cobalamin-independent)